MRRIIFMLTVAALMALSMSLAGPASAKSLKSATAPNCEKGQLTAALNSKQAVKHTLFAAACAAGIPPGQIQSGKVPVPTPV